MSLCGNCLEVRVENGEWACGCAERYETLSEDALELLDALLYGATVDEHFVPAFGSAPYTAQVERLLSVCRKAQRCMEGGA